MFRFTPTLSLLALTACASVAVPAGPSPEPAVALPAVALTVSEHDATLAGLIGSSPTDRCTVTVEETCSPYARDRGLCQVDSTRWAHATYEGSCGTTEPEWEIRPDPKTAWPTHTAQAFQWHHGGRVGYFRGECGDYQVRAHAPEADSSSEWLPIRLPAPLCDGN